MAKYEVFYVNIVPHPDTKGSKGWYIVEGGGLRDLDAEPDPWDADEVQGKGKAVARAKELARYVVDTKQAERATVYSEMVGGAIYTYPAKRSKAKRRPGGKKRHGTKQPKPKFKLGQRVTYAGNRGKVTNWSGGIQYDDDGKFYRYKLEMEPGAAWGRAWANEDSLQRIRKTRGGKKRHTSKRHVKWMHYPQGYTAVLHDEKGKMVDAMTYQGWHKKPPLKQRKQTEALLLATQINKLLK